MYFGEIIFSPFWTYLYFNFKLLNILLHLQSFIIVENLRYIVAVFGPQLRVCLRVRGSERGRGHGDGLGPDGAGGRHHHHQEAAHAQHLDRAPVRASSVRAS